MSIVKKQAFSVVEAMLSVAMLGFIVAIAGGVFWYSQKNDIIAGNRDRAILLADEGLEAVRNIRDHNFADLEDGKFFLDDKYGSWELSTTANKVGIFERTVTIKTISTDIKDIVSYVRWSQDINRSGNVSAETYLTNWRKEVNIIKSCSKYCEAVGYYEGSCKKKKRYCRYPNTIESEGNKYCTGKRKYCCCQPIRNCKQYCKTITYDSGSCKGSILSCRAPKVYESGGDKYCTDWWWSSYCCCRP